MAEKYSFFNAVVDSSGEYDRTYAAEDMAEYFASFIGNGVYASAGNGLQVTAAGDYDITVGIGKAWINGYFYENTTAKTLTLSLPSGTNNRIDNIVVRLDLTNRLLEVAIVKGAEAVTPVAPTLTRNTNIYEICLAQILVAKNAEEITQGNITDTRPDSSLCGYVTGVVDQIDATEVFEQCEEQFKEWFADIQDVLDKDTAGNLLNKINNVWQTIYPVGSIYMSVNSTSPATLFGGTWEAMEDRFLLGASDTYAAGATGGETEHTLTTDEIPSHNHRMKYEVKTGGSSGSFWGMSSSSSSYIGSTYSGGGKAHNNMPPYLAVYMWKRTA